MEQVPFAVIPAGHRVPFQIQAASKGRPLDDARDVNVSLGMADCDQHAIEQLPMISAWEC